MSNGYYPRLFVYGTLMPGQANHHYLAAISGRWEKAWVKGRLYPEGLGLALGYPALVLDEKAEPVAGWLLHADGLQQHWPELDAFEGIAYRRIATEVFTGCGDKLTAYLYELAEGAEYVE